MSSRFLNSQNVFESGFATVTSGGHWFHATRETVEGFVPGLLKVVEYEKIVLDAVTWVESTDSLALLIYFALIFNLSTAPALLLTAGFYVGWHLYKSAFVNLVTTPVLKLLNQDFLQIGVAAVALSLLGMGGDYSGLLAGIILFFLFKVGLLRMLLSRFEMAGSGKRLTLNDRVLKMLLLRHALYEDLAPAEVSRLEEQMREAFLKLKKSGGKSKKRSGKG